MLPEEPNYWPSLSATVKDYVMGGVYEPILGYFALDLQAGFEKAKAFRKKFAENKMITQNKKRIQNRSARLEGINDKVLLNLRNFILKSINYSWKINGPKLKLNKITG